MFFPAADTIAFAEGGVEVMRIDSAGNVGIGTSSPAYRLQIAAAPATSANFVAQFAARTSGADANVGDYSQFGGSGDSGYFGRRYNATIGWMAAIGGTNAVAFHTGNIGSETERARIDSSGNLLVGNTDGVNARLNVVANSNNVVFFRNSSGTGTYLVSGNTGWTTASDERVKDIIEPITDAAAKVSSLRAVIGKYKTDEDGTRRTFLIAQDVQAVLPEAVNVQNDEQGTLGLQYTDTIPLLVAAIKEQQALITSLTARIAALEGAAQ
jgi:hypothetical protein